MSYYTPNRWMVMEISPPNKQRFYRVFGTWGGSYAYGASWKLNSGITSVEVEGDKILFHGASGSVYECHKDAYGIADSYNVGVYEKILEKGMGFIKPMDADTDWTKLKYLEL